MSLTRIVDTGESGWIFQSDTLDANGVQWGPVSPTRIVESGESGWIFQSDSQDTNGFQQSLAESGGVQWILVYSGESGWVTAAVDHR